jgi:hypothetical protein
MSAARLDERILAGIGAWRAGNDRSLDERWFDRLARDLFCYQVRNNEPYRRFAGTRGFDEHHVPATWKEIPAVPAAAFKDATLATFEAARAELEFHTSGTTSAVAGRHYMERAALYDAALLSAFRRFMLPDGARLRYLNLVPDPRCRPRSSLGYMMRRVGEAFGEGPPRFYLRDDDVEAEAFERDLRLALNDGRAVCIAGTAFAFVALLDELERTGAVLACAPGSRIMETGGFKGRTRDVSREALYGRLAARLAIQQERIVAEYGMTELTSQYYDTVASRGAPLRVKAGPPWLRAVVVGPDGREAAPGTTGMLRHVDLANRSSVVAVQTEDRGYAVPGGFVLLGRDASAPLRGCSLDHEDLVARRG